MQKVMSDRPATGRAPLATIARMSVRSKVPACRHNSTMPIRRPTSPAFVIQNAFTAATDASGFQYQKPISRYEQSPTSSHAMNSCRKLGASTSAIIEKAKSD